MELFMIRISLWPFSLAGLTSAVAAVLLLKCGGANAQTTNRYDSFRFGVCYYPEQWPESLWDRDASQMEACGVNTVRIGEFGWARIEPREGHYDFTLFDRAIATLGRHGIKTIFGTPTAAPPKWLTSKHPEILNVLDNGQRVNDQSRRQYTYNSTIYRRYCREIVEALARHYRDNTNIIGWQIDNEMNNENPDDFTDSARTAFRAWLRAKYGTLDELNARWGTVVWSQIYSDWNQIDLPFPTPAFHNPALMLDYRRFTSDSAADFLNEQVAILRKYRRGDFLTHNGVFKNINYYDFSRNLDIYAYDNYPTFDDSPRFLTGARLTMVRSFKGQFMIMEQLTGPAGQTYLLRTPRPGETRLWAMQTVAYGADGLLHFRWRSALRGAEEYWYGVLDHDNVPRDRFNDFKQEGMEMQKIAPQIIGSTVNSQIAVIKDFEDEWVSDYQFLTQEINIPKVYEALFQAASEQRYNVDFVGPSGDLSRYKVVFAPQLALMDKPLAERLRQFVAQGGTLIMSAESAIKDRDNAFTMQTIPIGLTNLFGVELDSFQTYQPPSAPSNAVHFDDGATTPVDVFAEVLHPTTARVIGRWQGDYLKNSPAATEQQFGQGKAVYYGSLFNLEAARQLIGRYAREAGLKHLLEGVPEQVEVTCRSKGPADFYFLLNHADSPITVNAGEGFVDALSGEPADSSLTLGPFDYRVLKRDRSADITHK